MTNEETFILLSLEEQQSKELAQVISNETARKILDYLGKKILYYRLAKKLIVIAPKTSESLYNQLKNLIPVSLFTLVTGSVIYYFTRFSDKINSSKQVFSELIPIGDKAVDSGALSESAMKITENLEAGQTLQVVNKTTEVITQTQNITNEPLWFFIGAGFVIILMLIIILTKRKKIK